MSFNFMAAVIILSDFGETKKIKTVIDFPLLFAMR